MCRPVITTYPQPPNPPPLPHTHTHLADLMCPHNNLKPLLCRHTIHLCTAAAMCASVRLFDVISSEVRPSDLAALRHSLNEGSIFLSLQGRSLLYPSSCSLTNPHPPSLLINGRDISTLTHPGGGLVESDVFGIAQPLGSLKDKQGFCDDF